MIDGDELSAVFKSPLSDAIQKLKDLLSQSGRAFLLGAGCSKCANLPLTAELTQKALESKILNEKSKLILGEIKKFFDGASPAAHIEDFLSELVDLLAIANRRSVRNATAKTVTLGGTDYTEADLSVAAEEIKRAIADVINQRVAIETHKRFVEALHRPLRPGKTSPGQSIDYLVLNYDTIVEDALALARVPFSDGMDGGVSGWWNPATFDRNDLSARVFKLHGSINWHELPGNTLPYRVAANVELPDLEARRILIWPASTKYRETQLRSILPDSMSGLTKMLSGLRRQEAIFVGQAATLPSRIMMRSLSPEQLPRSNDVDFDKGWQSPAMTSDQLAEVAKRWRYQTK